MAQQNSFLASPLDTVTDRIQQERFELPPLPKEEPAAAPAQPQAAAPKQAKKGSSSDDYAPPAEFRPLFESAARKYNVPVNVLMALGHQESRFNPTAIGQPTQWGRAKGMMQYLDDTASRLGINPFEPTEAIDAAAKQIRQRLDKGYSMEDAVKAHFAGDDRRLWKEKTAAYGSEVLAKAARIGEALYPFDQSPEEVARRDRQRTEIEAQEVERDRLQQPTASQGLPMPQDQKAIDERGFFDRAGNALSSGYENMVQSLNTARFAVAGGDSTELARSLSKKFQREANRPKTTGEKEIDAAFQAVTDANGAWDTVKAGAKAVGTAITNPKDLAVGIVEQAPNMLPTVAGGAGGAGAGGAAGAGVGALFGGVGALPGAATGAIWGGRAGMVAGTTATELGAEVEQMILERLQAQKAAPTEQNIKALLDNQAFQSEARTRGLKKGLTVALVDQIFLGLGGKVASAPARQAAKTGVAPTLGRRAAAGGAAIGLDATGEVVGEAASQKVARGEVDAGDALREGVYGLGQSIVEPTIGAGIEAAKRATTDNSPGAQVGRELDRAVSGTQFSQEEINQQAVAALDPNQSAAPVQQAAPTVTVTAPAPSQADGPLTRAVENAAEQPQRVTVTAPEGEVTGFVLDVTQDDQGNSVTRVLGDDGQTYNFTSADAVEIKPESGPLTKALEKVAAKGAPQPVNTGATANDDLGIRDVGQQGNQAAAQAGANQQGAGAGDQAGDAGMRGDAGAFEPGARAGVLGADATADAQPALSQQQGTAADVAGALGQMARREHPATVDPRVDRILAAETYLQNIAANDSERAAQIAADFRATPEKFAEVAGVSPEIVGRYASIIERRLGTYGKQPAAAPEATATAAPANLEAMTEPELRAQLKAVAGQAKEAGWTPELKEQRRQIESRINKLVTDDFTSAIDPAPADLNELEAKVYADLTAAMNAQFGEDVAAELIERAAVMTDGQSAEQFFLALEGLTNDRQQQTAESNPAGQEPTASQPAEGSAGAAQQGQEGQAEEVAPAKDEYAGKWFGSEEKAQAFIDKKKAGATHEAVQTGKVRWEIKPKRTEAEINELLDNEAKALAVAEISYGEQNATRAWAEFSEKNRLTVAQANDLKERAKSIVAERNARLSGSKPAQLDDINVADSATVKESLTAEPVEEVPNLAPAAAQPPATKEAVQKRIERISRGLRKKRGASRGDSGYTIAMAEQDLADIDAMRQQDGADTEALDDLAKQIDYHVGMMRKEEAAQQPAPAAKRAATVIDNRDTNPGEFIVRGDGTNLARFEIGRNGKPVRVKYFHESQATRNIVDQAMADFLKERNAEIDRLFGSEQNEPAEPATPAVEEVQAEDKQQPANLPAVRSATKVAEVVDEPVENPDELIKAIADAVRGDAQVRFVKDKDTGRFNLSIKGLFIGTMDKQPAKAEEALAVAARRYMEALAAAGRTMPQDPRQMTRDQFVAVNGLAGLVQDFEVTGPIDAEGSGVKIGDNGLFYTDHDALYDRIQAEAKPTEPTPPTGGGKPSEYGANNKLVSRERAAELRDRLKQKLSGTQLNSGIDPELLAIGTELAVFHIEAGARKFAQFAKAIAEDLDMPVSSLRPYLRSWYNGARDMTEDMGGDVAGMDSAEVVREELAKLDAAEAAATITEEVKQNDRNADQAAPAGGAGNRALEGAPAQEVRGTESSGNAEQRSPAGSREDAGRAGQTDRAGFSSRGGMGGSARNVPVPAGRAGGKRGGAGQPGLQAAAATEQADAGPVTEQRAAETAEARKAPIAGDYRITDLTRLGEGGQKTKFRNNMAAIRLLNDLQQSGRQASAEEQDILARYVGWGGIAQAFDPDNAEWSKEYAELKDLLTPEEWDAAKESTQYAHYTSQEIIAGMYDALKRMGFSGGKIVEPGSGVGNFIGLMPEELRSSSRFTAVERERIAGGIAKMLYPNQNVQQQDFRKFNAQDGYFDVALGNPPFSATTLTDLSGRKHLSGLSVHNYFFAKSIDMLREGGVLAMVVSNSFLDAKGDKARRYIGERAELLGAIRLPNNAFAKNANTEVTTDIIFLRKRPESEWGGKAAKDDMKRWQNLGTVPDPAGGDAIPLNQYFIDNPQMMLGRMERAGSMYRAGQPALIARAGQDTAALMRQAISRLPENAFTPAVVKNTASMQEAEITALADDANVDVGGHYLKDGELFVRLGDVAGEGRAMKITATTKISEKRELGKNGLDRLKQLADMRVTVRQLLAAEIADAPNMEELRAKLNQQYDSYVKEFGYINQRTTVQLFGDDPDFPLLASLEHGFDPGIGAAAAKSQGVKAVPASAKKAPIFSRRVIEKHEEITKADTPEDALMVSIAERGKIDPAYIGSLLGRDGAAVLEELTKGDKPALFVDPATGGYVLRDAYLSGNVRKKLAQAKAAGMYGNVAELEKVIPEDIPAHEISGKIGAPWVPTEVYEQFAQEIMGEGTKARVVYVPAVSSYIASFEPGSEVANTNTFGTTRMGADELYSALLNSKEIKVGHYEEDPSTRSRRFVLEKDATDEANDKAREIKDKFNDWLFADADRAEKMQRAYNDAVNNYVTRIFDGSMLKFPGKVPDAIIKLRRHQRNAVARIIQDGTALLDHVVGAGKTFTVIAAAMELKRTGLAKKPMIVVPNHLVKQWAADFYRLYPGANILTATKKDFEKANRRKFLAKIATGNWDAVIIAHSSFGFIKPDAEFELRFNQDRIDEILEAIEQLKQESGQDSKRTVKQLAKMKEGLENKLASLRDKPMDDLLDFGQIGVDHVFVDEAHLFKNLMFVTKMQNVRGLGQPKGSQRAYDMFIKTHQIYDQSGNGRGVVFATGTPVSNSLAEMYHMLRYLAPQTLQDSGQFTFDAWAKTYADVEQVWMQALSGEGYKASNRMSRFVNTPELLRVFDQVADTVTIDDIKQAYAEENNGAEFPIPKLKNGRRTPVSIPRSQAQTDYMNDVGGRAKQLEQRKGKPKKGDDNMLSIMGDARKAAMDIRMVRPEITERDPNGRIAMAARNIMERYQRYNDVRGTQLVFSDMGTPKKQAEKELKEYNELMAATAPLSDEQVLAMAELGDESAQEALEKAEEAQRKIEAKGQDWLDAIRSAMRGFSVYDDLKDALVEMGIPENEIAFIHDYNTDDQKAALFRAVNDGKVRVLLGSTEKMGAGTNVQERAVALHHLDVPWKPSDIEQREGRVIRQGNKLLDQIPGFEVEVLAYATQDTLDLFMWQTQEKKLSMIGQLRTGNVGREVDNAFEEMQMSAGEMQAAATSNPYLLEEIQLKDKVKRLERQKRSFEGQKNDLANRRKKAEKALEELPAQIAAAEKVEKTVDKTLADIDAHFAGLQATVNGEKVTGANNIRNAVRDAINATPVEEKGGKEVRKINIEFNGKEYTSQTGLADAVNKDLGDAAQIAYTLPSGETVYRSSEVAAELIDPVANMIEAETDQTELGKVGAFEVTAYRMGSGKLEISVSLNGDEVSSYEVRFDAAEPGAITNTLRAIPNRVQQAIMSQKGNSGYLNYKLESAKKTLADIESKPAAGDWDGEAELKKAREDYRSVLKKLAETGESKEEATSEEPRYSVNAEGQAVGEFGPVTEEFRNDPAGAIQYLQQQRTGEAIVEHPKLGEISLIWGDGKMGLSHIAARRGEDFLSRIASILQSPDVYEKENQIGRVFLGDEGHEATIRLDWNGQAKAWLVSAYEKYGDAKQSAQPQQANRSDVVRKRSGKLTVDDLRDEVTSGAIGPVVARMIDNGQIVLHQNAETLPKAARGKKGVQAVTLANGQIHLVANRLSKDNARPVLLHEMFHMGGQALVGSKEWGNLMGRLGSLHRQAELSTGKAREFFDRARERVAAARAQGAVSTGMTVEEFGAYAIEEWEQKRDSLPAVIRKWVEDFIGHIKAYVLQRYGKQLGDVTPAQLAAMAKLVIMNAAVLAERGQLDGVTGKFSSTGTIDVDGVERPITNSNGKMISPTEDGVRNFWRWFGNSKVVDDNGRPLVMYHGTSMDVDFSKFKVGKRGAWFTSNQEVASDYAEQNDSQKDQYNPDTRRYEKVNYSGRVIPVYLRIENPYSLTNEDRSKVNVGNYAKAQRELFSTLQGHDGILWNNSLSKEWVVLDAPNQVKSAIGNNGDFDPTKPDIRFSVKPEEVLDEASASLDAPKVKDDYIGRVVGDISLGARLLVHPRTVAAVHKEFTPVYRTAISQMETRDKLIAEFGADVKAYDMLDQQGKENVNKVLELGRLTSAVYSAKVLRDGVANPGEKQTVVMVNGKPMMAKEPIQALLTGVGEVVKLNEQEIKAYQDLRRMFDAALDKMRDQTLEEMGFPEFVGMGNAAAKIVATITKEMSPERAERIQNIARFVAEIEQAKRAGYVPFARYGDYVVTVKEKIADVSFVEDDKDHYIAKGLPDSFAPELVEMGAERNNEGWRILKSQKRDVERLTEKTIYSTKVETGLTDIIDERRAGKVDDIAAVKDAIDEARKEWVDGHPNRRIVAFKTREKKTDQPVKLSDVDALAEVANIDNGTWDAIRDKLSDAIKAKGFRRHFFHSDNVPGYTGDFERSIADYVIGMSGYLSRRQHMKRWDNAVSGVEEKPKLFEYASKYRDYVNNPQEELAMIRQIGFFAYIAGVMASAFANLTQVPLMTVPTLAQVAPLPLVVREIGRAYKDAAKMISAQLDMFDPDKAPADVRAILKEAWAEGSFVPLESFDLMMTARQRNVGARKGVKAFNKATQLIALSFTFAERMNRLVTFIASARLAGKHAVKENAKTVLAGDALARAEVLRSWNPKSFAEWAVDESQYRMGKANRPSVMRGVGSAIMQFKGFMMQTFEAWYRMAALHGKEGRYAAAASVLALYAFAGIWGLPGADDLRKLLENIYKTITSKDLDLQTELRAWIARTSGSNAVAQMVSKGASYPLGVDLTRVGMGSVVPDSPLAAAGIPFDILIGRPKRAFEKATAGDELGAVGELTPNFIKHWLVAGSWALEGVRDKQGNRILTPDELSAGDLAMKALGFQPSIVTDVRDYEYAQRRQETAVDGLKRSYTNRLAKAIVQVEAASPEEAKELEEQIDAIYAEIDEHNATAAPEEVIKIDNRSLRTKIAREREGVKSTWGKERKAGRQAAEELRGVFGLQPGQEDDE